MLAATQNRRMTDNGGARRGAGRKTEAERGEDSYRRYDIARAKREEHNAEIAEMEARKMAGELGELSAMDEALQRVVANAQVKALAIPHKVAPLLVGLESLAEVQAILMAAVREMLSELAADGRRG